MRLQKLTFIFVSDSLYFYLRYAGIILTVIIVTSQFQSTSNQFVAFVLVPPAYILNQKLCRLSWAVALTAEPDLSCVFLTLQKLKHELTNRFS